jgi:hypothetical protein
MKIEEPRAMRELHEIRAKHYEETKHMTRDILNLSMKKPVKSRKSTI